MTEENVPNAANDNIWRQASVPFDRPDADIIFRTSDGVVFGLHKLILSISSESSILGDLIGTASSSGDSGAKVPIVVVPEESRVLDHLFRFCYPVAAPKLTTLEDIRDVLAAAAKYRMTGIVQMVGSVLLTFAQENPIPVFAIAYHHGLNEVACVAAAFVEETHFTAHYQELECISAGVYWGLIKHVLDWKTNPFMIWTPPGQETTKDSSLTKFWAIPPSDETNNDIILQSSDGVHFRLQKVILSTASPFFQTMFTLPQGETYVGVAPVVAVAESGKTLDFLCKLIYPSGPEAQFNNVYDICAVLEAVTKYDMTKQINILKRRLTSFIPHAPVAVFLISDRHGFSDIAAQAARSSLQYPILNPQAALIEQIDPQIDVTAQALYRLIRYQSKCTHAVSGVTSDKGWTKTIVSGSYPIFPPQCSCKQREFRGVGVNSFSAVPSWLDAYVDEVTSTVKSKPCSSSLKNESMLDQPLIQALRCGRCSLIAIATLRACRDFLMQKIDEELDKVQIYKKPIGKLDLGAAV